MLVVNNNIYGPEHHKAGHKMNINFKLKKTNALKDQVAQAKVLSRYTCTCV